MLKQNKKVSRMSIFSQLKEIDKLFCQGFIDFLIKFKPSTINDLTDRFAKFAKNQNRQLEEISTKLAEKMDVDTLIQ